MENRGEKAGNEAIKKGMGAYRVADRQLAVNHKANAAALGNAKAGRQPALAADLPNCLYIAFTHA